MATSNGEQRHDDPVVPAAAEEPDAAAADNDGGRSNEENNISPTSNNNNEGGQEPTVAASNVKPQSENGERDGGGTQALAPSASSDKEDVIMETTESGETDNGADKVPDSDETQNLSFEDQANCVQDWMLSYLTQLLRLGGTKVLTVDDVGAPSKQDRADRTYETVGVAWERELERVARENERLRAEAKADRAEAKSKTKAGEQQPEVEAEGTEGKDEQPGRTTGHEVTDASIRTKKEKKLKTIEPSLSMTILRAFGCWRIVFAMVLLIVSTLLHFIPIILLNDLVKYFERGTDYTGYANPWVEVVGLGVVPVLVSLLQTKNNVIMQHLAVYARTGCSVLMYQKSLRISPTGKSRTSTGQVVNMMSNDTNQIMRFLQFVGMTLVSPIQIVISLVLIYQQVGHATWVGVAFMVCLAPVNAVVFRTVAKMRRKVLRYSDSRVKMVNDILGGIRIIKFYAWEKPFGKEVGKIREEELKALTKLTYVISVGFSVILMSAPIIQIILVFVAYVNIQDDPLSASVAFTTVALFNMMRFPFAILPMGFLQYIQSKISVRRIASYLQLPELERCVVKTPHPDEPEGSPGTREASITMRDCSFAWIDPNGPEPPPYLSERRAPVGTKKEKKKSRRQRKKEEKEARRNSAQSRDSTNTNGGDVESASQTDSVVLRDVSFTIEAGSLVAVVGEVGSGKSSLLSAILGEMEALDGSRVYIPRDERHVSAAHFTAYCSQTPWVVNDTVRGNVVFGREFDDGRYDEVLRASALTDDLAILPAGDMTEIGERGINLSGGQKARVCLARALYSRDAKVLLLDDPLSAVDAHVGEHLFNEAITGKISEGLTRILVTHHVHFLPRCDSVIVLKNGRIAHHGRYEDLVEQGVDFSGAVVPSDMASPNGETRSPPTPTLLRKSSDSITASTEIEESDRIPSERSAKTAGKELESVKDVASTDLKRKGETLMTEEGREEGSVAGRDYYHYASAGGIVFALLFVVAQGLSKGFEIGSSFWLAYWADETVAALQAEAPLTDSQTTYYVSIYALFGLLSVFTLAWRGIFMAMHRMKACRKLHQELTDSVLRAPVSFFDVTPTGRVLNRFAHDMDKVDLELMQSLSQGFNTMFSVLGALGAIVAATKGVFLIPLVPFGYVYYFIQKWFRKTSTELQRVFSMTKSPIFADFSQTLTGTSTIRAYGEETRFFTRCKSDFDKNNAAYVLVQLSNLWLGLRLDFLGGFVAAFVAALAVGTASANFIPAGWLGLALTYSIEVTNYLKHGVRMVATLEADMSSVERVLDYANNIEPEAPDVIPEKDPSDGTWPTNGDITVSHASMRYRDGPLVLKNLSFNIKGGEKIGVVGRTGSGKSSLMIALFRISELEEDGGTIVIDEINTSEIGTTALRSNLSIIPQEPVLFSNTVRYNLDPFGYKTEPELWAVLKKVKLAELITALPGGLEEWVAEGGDNFSQGQRQLLCIARSLLRDPKVLVMDEATASIDNATDAAIQEMIRENFSEATVLTIAHRLNTIMDSDRVLVLDNGEVAEFDSPSALLSKKDGIFTALVEKSRESRSGSAGR